MSWCRHFNWTFRNDNRFEADPPEADPPAFECQKNCQKLEFKKLPNIFFFSKKIAIENFFPKCQDFGSFFTFKGNFRRVRVEAVLVGVDCLWL